MRRRGVLLRQFAQRPEEEVERGTWPDRILWNARKAGSTLKTMVMPTLPPTEMMDPARVRRNKKRQKANREALKADRQIRRHILTAVGTSSMDWLLECIEYHVDKFDHNHANHAMAGIDYICAAADGVIDHPAEDPRFALLYNKIRDLAPTMGLDCAAHIIKCMVNIRFRDEDLLRIVYDQASEKLSSDDPEQSPILPDVLEKLCFGLVYSPFQHDDFEELVPDYVRDRLDTFTAQNLCTILRFLEEIDLLEVDEETFSQIQDRLLGQLKESMNEAATEFPLVPVRCLMRLVLAMVQDEGKSNSPKHEHYTDKLLAVADPYLDRQIAWLDPDEICLILLFRARASRWTEAAAMMVPFMEALKGPKALSSDRFAHAIWAFAAMRAWGDVDLEPLVTGAGETIIERAKQCMTDKPLMSGQMVKELLWGFNVGFIEFGGMAFWEVMALAVEPIRELLKLPVKMGGEEEEKTEEKQEKTDEKEEEKKKDEMAQKEETGRKEEKEENSPTDAVSSRAGTSPAAPPPPQRAPKRHPRDPDSQGFSPTDLSQVVWSIACQRLRPARLFAETAELLLEFMQELEWDDLSNYIWSLTVSACCSPTFALATAKRVMAENDPAQNITYHHAIRIAWSLTAALDSSTPLLLSAVKRLLPEDVLTGAFEGGAGSSPPPETCEMAYHVFLLLESLGDKRRSHWLKLLKRRANGDELATDAGRLLCTKVMRTMRRSDDPAAKKEAAFFRAAKVKSQLADGLLRVDVAMPMRKLALDAESEASSVLNLDSKKEGKKEEEPDGKFAVRSRCLRQKGWTLVFVPKDRFEHKSSRAAREALLKELLAKHPPKD